jgi:hypothetical protein
LPVHDLFRKYPVTVTLHIRITSPFSVLDMSINGLRQMHHIY